MSRFKGSPRGGLPGKLPAGEDMLWQGAPTFWALAKHAFRVRIVAAYFAFLIALRVGAALHEGDSLKFSLGTGLTGLWLGTLAIAMFCVLAWLIARSTTYTITTKRVVITYGMALPKSVNLPFSRLQAADLRINPEGTGDIVLKLPEKVRLSYLLLWPHVHGGKNGRAEPVLRGIPDPRDVAAILADAIGGALPREEILLAAAPAREALETLEGHPA